MEDTRISVSPAKLVTLALWTFMGVVLVAAWAAWFILAGPGSHSLWMMLGFTCCMSSAVAATAQIRCYVVQVCSSLRDAKLIAEAQRVRSLR